MSVTFRTGWDSPDDHLSDRSRQEVARIVLAARNYKELNKSPVATASDIEVVKGIHNDNYLGFPAAHITVEASFETYHIYLTQENYDSRTHTFVWEPNLICTGSQAKNGDAQRTSPYQRGKPFAPSSL